MARCHESPIFQRFLASPKMFTAVVVSLAPKIPAGDEMEPRIGSRIGGAAD